MTTKLQAEEAERMRRVPGIVFRDGTCGRVPCIVGTGLEVWEIVRGYRQVDEDFARLQYGYDWLSAEQLQAALHYASLYPDEVNARIAEDDAFDIEKLWAEYPFTRPPWR